MPPAVSVFEPPPCRLCVVDEAGGAGLRALVGGRVVIGLELLTTGVLGRGAAEVVGAVAI